MKTPIRALLIASTVVAVGLSSYSADPTVTNVSSGSVEVNTTDGTAGANSWKAVNGDVLNLTGGTVSVKRQGTGAANGIINATGGAIVFEGGTSSKPTVLNLINGSIIAEAVKLTFKTWGQVQINGGELSVGSGDTFAGTARIFLNSGTYNYNSTEDAPLIATGGTFNFNGGEVNLTAVSSIAQEVVFNSVADSVLGIAGATVYVGVDDSISGAIELKSGALYVENSILSPASFTQSGGTLAMTGSSLELSEGSQISTGAVKLTDSTLKVANGLSNAATVNATGNSELGVLNSSSLRLANGTIDEAVKVAVEQGSTLAVSGSAVLNLDSSDSLLGNLEMSDGTLNFSSMPFVANENSTFNMSGGTLWMDDSSLFLNAGSSVISTGGVINLLNNSELTFNNAVDNAVSIESSDASANRITLSGNSTLSLTDGHIDSATIVNIGEGSTLYQNSSSSELSMDSNDVWNGSLLLYNGKLTVDGITVKATDGNLFAQQSGTSNLLNSTITMDTANSYILNGTMNLENSTLNLKNGLLTNQGAFNIEDASVLNIADASVLNITGGEIADAAKLSVEAGSTLEISNGSILSINNNDTWSGMIKSDGILNITGMVYSTDDSLKYVQGQSGANTGVLNLSGTSLTLNENSYINNGSVNLTNASDLIFSNNRNNTASIVSNGESAVGEFANSITVADGSTLSLSGGTINYDTELNILGDLNLSKATLYIDKATDTWEGNLAVLSGNLTIQDFEKTSGFSMSGGNVNFANSDVELTAENDKLSGGNLRLNFGSAIDINNGGAHSLATLNTDNSVNEITIRNASNLDVLAGSVTEPSIVSLAADSALSISGASFVLDSATDTLDGSIKLNKGSVNLQNFNGSNAFETTATKRYNQESGTLKLIESVLTLNPSSSILGGTVNLTENSTLVFNNGLTVDSPNSAVINSKDGSDNVLSVVGYTALRMTDGVVDEATAVTIEEGSTYQVKEATSAKLTIDGTDTWEGALSLDAGTIALKNVSKNTTDAITYNQAGGALQLDGTTLNLATSSSGILGGVVELSNISKLILDNQLTNTASVYTMDQTENVLSVLNSTTLALIGGTVNKEAQVSISADSKIANSAGNLTIDAANDSWDGSLSMTGGLVNLDGLNKTTTSTNKYVQTNGTLNLSDTTLILDTTDSYITGGNTYINNQSSLVFKNGREDNAVTIFSNDGTASSLSILNNTTLKMLDGEIVSAAKFNVEENSAFNIAKGSVALDSSTDDVWDGSISLIGGTLTLANFESNGILNATGGTLKLNSGKLFIDDATSKIAAGTVTTIADVATLYVQNGSAFLNRYDTWLGDVYLTGGTLEYTGLAANGNLFADGGTLKVYNSNGVGTLNIAKDSYINPDTTVNLTGSGTISITDGIVYLNEGDKWDAGTRIILNGEGTLDFSDLNSNASVRFDGTTGNLDIHSGVFYLNNSLSFLNQAVDVAIDEGATLAVTAAKTAILDSTDLWNGNVSLGGSTLSLVGVNKSTTANSTYNQTAGTLSLQGSNVTLNEGSVISGGTVSYATSGDTSSLTISNSSDNKGKVVTSGRGDNLALKNHSSLSLAGSTIAKADKLSIDSGSSLILKGASSTKNTVALDNTDVWAGTINNADYSTLSITDTIKNESGIFTQTASNATTTVLGSSFALNNASDNISAGTFKVGDGTNTTTLEVSAGAIEAGAKVTLAKESAFDIKGGSVTLNSGDSWLGDISINGGALVYSGLASNANLNANTGDLTVTANATLTLNETSSVKEAVNVILANGSKIKLTGGDLELNSTDIWAGTIQNSGSSLLANAITKTGVYIQDSDSAALTIVGDSFTLGHTSDNISKGTLNIGNDAGDVSKFNMVDGVVADAVSVNIFNNATLNVEGGNLTLNAGDSIKENGKVALTNGVLTLDNFDLIANYTQTGGKVSLVNGSTLSLSEDVGSYIESGEVALNNGSTVTFNNPSIASSITLLTDTNTNYLNVNAGSVTLIGSDIENGTVVSLLKGATLVNQSTSTLNLNVGDSWVGTINNLGILNINGMDKQVGTDIGKLVQTSSVASTTILGSAFNLGNYDDEITAGALNVGDGTEANKANVTIRGTVGDGAKVNLTQNSSLLVDGGQLTIDATTNDSKDTWAGNITINEGTLNIFDFVSKDENGAALSIAGGTTNIYYTNYTVSEKDSILGGAINLNGSTMSLNNNDIVSGIKLAINGSSNLVIDKDSVVSIDSNDNWAGNITNNGGTLNLSIAKETSDTSKYTQTGGNLNITSNTLTLNEGSVVNGDATLGDAAITLSNGGGIIFNNKTTNAVLLTSGNPEIMLLDNTNNVLTVSDGTRLDLLAGSVVDASTVVDFSGIVNLAGSGNVTLNAGDILAGAFTNNGSIVNFAGVNKTGTYVQNSGQANVYSNFILNSTDAINAGGLKVDNNSILTLGTGIADSIVIELGAGSTLDIQAGTNVVLNSAGDYADSINGAVKNAGGLTATGLVINSYTHDNGSSTFTNSTLTANGAVTGGDISMTNSALTAANSITNTTFTLNENSSLVSNGGVITGSNITLNEESVLSINNGSTTNSISLNTDNSANNLNLTNNSTLEVSSGDILAQTIVNLTEGSILKVGTSSVAIDDTDDTWLGTVELLGTNSTLNLQDYDAKPVGILKAEQGNINLRGDTKIALGAGSDIREAVALSIGENAQLTLSGASLTLDSSDAWDGKVIMSEATTTLTLSNLETGLNSKLDASKGALVLNNSTLNLGSGSEVASEVGINIQTGSTLNVAGGDLYFDGLAKDGVVADVWDGTLSIGSGNLYLTDISNGVGAIFTQSSGNVYLDNSVLNLAVGSSISGGNVDLSNVSTLNINNGETTTASITSDTSANKLTLSNTGTKLNIIGGTVNKETEVTIGTGTSLNVDGAGASLTLDGLTDTWEGTLTLNSGNLYLDNMEKDSEAIFKQTGGTTTVYGTSFDMNNTADEILAGSLIIEELSKVTVSEGTISENATIVLKDKAELNILTDGSVDEGNTSSGPNWDGHVKVDGGKLTISDNDSTTNKEGYLTQTSGEVVISGTGFNLNDSRDNLSGGKLTINDASKLTVSNGTIGANSEIDLQGTLSLSGGNVTITSGDVWDGLLEMLEAGNANLTLDGFTGINQLTQKGGTLTLDNSSALTLADGSEISGGTVNIQNVSTLSSGNSVIKNILANLTEASTLDIANGSDANIINLVLDTSANKLLVRNSSGLKLAGTVGANSIVDIEAGSDVTIADGATLTFNTTDGSKDTWAGSVSLEGANSNFRLSDYIGNAGTLNADQGNITLENGTNLNLAGGSIADRVNLVIGTGTTLNLAGASLTMDELDDWSGTIEMGNVASTLTLKGLTTGDDANLLASAGNLVLDNSTLTIGASSNIDNAVDLDIKNNSLVKIDGGNLALDSADKWNSKVQLENGSLTLSAPQKGENGVLVQNNGTLDLSAAFEMNNVDDAINAGIFNANGYALTVKNGLISATANLNLADVTVTGGVVSLNGSDSFTGLNISENGNVVIDSITAWSGSTEVTQSGGELTVKGYDETNANGKINSSNGILTIEDGVLTIATGSSVADDTRLVINNGATALVDGGNFALSDSDTWNGTVKIADGSFDIAVSESNKNGAFVQDGGVVNLLQNFVMADENDAINGGTFNAGGKNLTVKEGLIAEAADVTLANVSVQGGVVTLNGSDSFTALDISNGDVTIDSLTAWGGTVSHSNGNLTIKGYDDVNKNGQFQSTGGTLTVDTGRLTISTGSSVSADSTFVVNSGATAAIDGGNAVINSGDTWDGNVELNGGNLTIDGYDKVANASSTYTQNSGTLTLNESTLELGSGSSVSNGIVNATDSNLEIGTGSSVINSEVTLAGSILDVTGGDLVGANTITMNDGSEVNFENGKETFASITTSGDDNKLTLSNTGTKLNLIGGTVNKETEVTIGTGTSLNVDGAGASLTLDGLTDTWEGTLTLNSGNLYLDNMEKDSEAIFKQTGGTTTVYGTTFDMNNTADEILAGSLIIEELSKVTVSEGTISENATIVLKDKAELNILTDGSVDEGNTSSGPNWDGHVKVDGGKLTISDNDSTTNKEGYLTQTSGEVVITGTGFNLNDSRDNLSGGKLTINDGSKLTVSNGTIGANSEIDLQGTLSLSGGNVTITSGDVWDGLLEMLEGGNANLTLDNASKTGAFTQASGKTTILGDFQLNNSGDLISGGELVLENGKLTISQGAITSGADINFNENTTIALEGGNLDLNRDDIWNGKVTVSSGKLNISDIASKGENATITQTGGDVVVNNNFNLDNAQDKIVSGNLTVKNGADLTVSKGSIESDAVLDIESGANLTIAGGSATLKNDNWNGNVTLSSGNLSIAQDKVTSADSKFNQTGGTLDLAANLTLKEGSSVTGDSVIKLTDAALLFDNNTNNKASITTDELSTLGVNAGSSLELVNGIVTDNAVLNVLGTLVIADNSKVSITDNDTWTGNVTLANSELTLNTDKLASVTSTYNQSSGKLTVNNSQLALYNGSAITGGDVTLNNADLLVNGTSEVTSTNIYMNNSSSLEFNNGKTNSGIINADNSANSVTINTGSNFNLLGGAIEKETLLSVYGGLGIHNGSEVTVDGTDIWNGKISLVDGTLILDNVATAGQFEAQSGTLKIFGSNTTLGAGLAVNKGVTTIVDSSSTMNINGGSVVFDGNATSNDTWGGAVSMANGSFTMTDGFKHTSSNGNYTQTGGSLIVNNGAELSLTDALSTVTGSSVLLIENKGSLTIANGAENTGSLQTSGNSNFVLANASTFNTTNATNVAASTKVALGEGTNFNLKSGKLVLDNNDNWMGKVNVSGDGELTLVNKNSAVGAEGDLTSNRLEQAGGTLSLKNTVLTLYEDTSDILKEGSISLDNYSRVNLASAWTNQNIDLRTAGTISSMNNAVESNSLGALLVDNVNGRADFAIDIYEDAINGTYTPDRFDFTSIAGVNSNRDAVINISDWNLVSNVNGMPLINNKVVDLGKIFDTEDLGENVKFTATAEDIVTPVSRYKLKADEANDGSYFLDIVGYNKQSFRGQVASVSQLMNQLVINDILFDRMLLTPQTLVPSNFANKSAYVGQAGVPAYTYSRKDPGLWFKAYGNFENLRMTNDLKVENNAYGSLVGADLGTFELANGWNWIPTIYMGYNGAHQTFEGVSMYENGGQVGAMGTFFNEDWITSILAYASMYNMEMSMNGSTDEDFNFYAGTAVKSAYNWRIKDHFIVQPSATVSYNFFGGPKWQSTYGQIGMTTGTLNGLNVAPGVNFIWQQDTWSLFATVAYVYNCMGRVGGSAAGVDLPDVWVRRGYLQYGFGASKEITDRFSAYAQIILRNVGRTGIGFQGELIYKF